jgi:hypothetical protein
MRRTVGHKADSTGCAEPTSVATESNEFLMFTRLASNTQKAMLKASALQATLELSDDVARKIPVLVRQHFLEQRPVCFDQLAKKAVLWLMSVILKWSCNRRKIGLGCVRRHWLKIRHMLVWVVPDTG